jgi:hypothetical protein
LFKLCLYEVFVWVKFLSASLFLLVIFVFDFKLESEEPADASESIDELKAFLRLVGDELELNSVL